MRLIKYENMNNDPWYDLDRLFERALGDFSRAPGFWGGRSRSAFRLDIYQDDENHHIVAELPGFDRKDVTVELENEVLTITATRKGNEKDGSRDESYSRSITVDRAIDVNKVKAHMENGLLHVTLPKSEERKPKLIKVS